MVYLNPVREKLSFSLVVLSLLVFNIGVYATVAKPSLELLKDRFEHDCTV